MAGLPVAFTSEFYDDVNKKRQWTAFCAKKKSYVEKAEFKAVMEAIRTLALKRLSMHFVREVLKTRNDANYRI